VPVPEPRARDLGIPLDGTPGEWNAITDVPGLEVGYVTLADGPVQTGVTAILPRGRDGVGVPCAAGTFSFNGNGEMTGTAWIAEAGGFATPVALTNTHALGSVHRGVVEWTLARDAGVAVPAAAPPTPTAQWVLPVVSETWDGYLNDVDGDHVTPAHAVAALDAASSGPVAEGAVGGGTGMCCYEYKGGSGTSSRRVPYAGATYTVGAFVQANFGDRRELVVAGRPVGRELLDDNPMASLDWLAPAGAGSVVVLVATDAPLLPGQCTALARRAMLGVGRTGTSGSHFSGDLVLAFSTANPGALTSAFPLAEATEADYETLRFVPWGRVDPFYEAVVQSVEEAVLNALCAGRETVGRDGRRVPGLPLDRLRELLA
jgi:L-aminopeptidase/D-esterase-like protein